MLAVDELQPGRVPVTGRVRVSVEQASTWLGRVELTGQLWAHARPAIPVSPIGRWYQLQGIDAGMSVPDARYVNRLPDRTRGRGWCSPGQRVCMKSLR